jgi:parallel beta-helix repeat protein
MKCFVLLIIVFLTFSSSFAQNTPIYYVPADFDSISEALENVPDHAIIEIATGDYAESLIIEHPVTLRGTDTNQVNLSGSDNESVIQIVGTEHVFIEKLIVNGGKYGIYITNSQDVTIQENVITNSRLVGIKVRLGAASILNNEIRDARPPYGKGIHVANTTQWPPSHIIGNTISGNARSGIVTNMTAMIFVENNIVTANGQHGISITEMSHAFVADNIVDQNVENGIYILDMSMASICNNEIRNTAVAAVEDGVRYGNGILIDFHSEAEVHNNIVTDNTNYGIQTLFGSYLVAGANDIQGNRLNVLPRNTVNFIEDESDPANCKEASQ